MNRNYRRTLLVALLGLAIIVSLMFVLFRSYDKKPNIVLMVVDSLRPDHLSYNGYYRITSPNIDKFAKENIVFANATTVAASTPPAMAAIMTSRLPYYQVGEKWQEEGSFGMSRFYRNHEQRGLATSLDTLAEILRRNGYTTAGFITNPYLKKIYHFDQGFDTFQELFREPPLRYGSGEDVSQRALDWLDNNKESTFFLYLHYMDVHLPYLPPEDYRNCFQFDRIPGRSDADVDEAWRKEKGLLEEENTGIKEHMTGLYDCCILYTDACLGKVLGYLETKRLMDNTIVVIASDHGEEFLEHGGTTHKGTLYEEVVRVPLIMHFPGHKHEEIHAPVRNFDLMPTLLDYCQVGGLAADIDATSLLPLVDGKNRNGELTTFASFPKMGRFNHRLMIRDRKYKLIQNIDKPEKSELFDILSDPAEQENLYDKEDNVKKRLQGRLEEQFGKLEKETKHRKPQAADGYAPQKIDKETREQLRGLGYLD